MQAYDANVYDKWELEEPDDIKKICPFEELSYIPAMREDRKLVDIGSNSRLESPSFLNESRECWPFTRDFDAKENTDKDTNEEPDLGIEEIPEENYKLGKLSMCMENLQEVVENNVKVPNQKWLSMRILWCFRICSVKLPSILKSDHITVLL